MSEAKNALNLLESQALRDNPTESDLESRQNTQLPVQAADELKVKDDIVDWNGPDDPENPLNWPFWKRIAQVILASVFVLYANLAATMFAPGAAELVKEFHVTNSTVATFTVSIYLLGFALGPLTIAPLSEQYGRLIVYHSCNTVYLAFTIGCALSTDIAMFLVFRFIAGCAASGPLTIGGGTVADVIPQEKRGKAMAIFGMGPLLGPVIGPIIGGFVAENIGWRWTFWLITILASTFSIIGLVALRETNATIILNRRAARLRKETGNSGLISKYDRGLKPRQLFLRAVLRPTKLLVLSPIVLLLSLFSAFVFGLIFLLFTTFPIVFEEQYGFSPGISGLSYLGLGIGMAIGLGLFGALSDRLLQKHKQGQLAKPEGRLLLMVWFCPIVPIGFFWYGWSAYEHRHWIVPIIGTLFIGLGALFVIIPAQIYMVDAFGPEAAASALAVNTVIRTLFGAFLPLAGTPMYAKLGLGWGNSLLGFICLLFVPVPIFFHRYGGWLRERFVVKL